MSNYEPAKIDIFVSEITRLGKSQYIGAVFPVQARLQAPLYGFVEAFTAKAGTSRNKVLNQLIEIGIEEAMKALPPEVAADIRGHAGKIIMDNAKTSETDEM